MESTRVLWVGRHATIGRTGARLIACLLTIVLCLAKTTAAQTVTTIPGRPACASCRFVADSLFALGNPSDTIRVISIANIERDSRGRFFGIAEGYEAVLLFDHQGKHIRTIGRKGGGPGEFAQRVTQIRVGAGDSLFVSTARQLSVFDSAGTFIRRFTLPGQMYTFYPLPDGSFVAGMTVLTRAGVGLPLHIVNADGSVRRSFGPERRAGSGRGNDASSREATIRAQTPFALSADKRSIWAPLPDYMIERWYLDDRAPERFVINSPWLRPGSVRKLIRYLPQMAADISS